MTSARFWLWVRRLSEHKLKQISPNIHEPCPNCHKFAHQEIMHLRARVVNQRHELHMKNLNEEKLR